MSWSEEGAHLITGSSVFSRCVAKREGGPRETTPNQRTRVWGILQFAGESFLIFEGEWLFPGVNLRIF
jgi:hypothetical protein